jgi:hypothetical protein
VSGQKDFGPRIGYGFLFLFKNIFSIFKTNFYSTTKSILIDFKKNTFSHNKT